RIWAFPYRADLRIFSSFSRLRLTVEYCIPKRSAVCFMCNNLTGRPAPWRGRDPTSRSAARGPRLGRRRPRRQPGVLAQPLKAAAGAAGRSASGVPGATPSAPLGATRSEDVLVVVLFVVIFVVEPACQEIVHARPWFLDDLDGILFIIRIEE